MLDHLDAPTVPLPKQWVRHVRSAALHIIGLARLAAAEVRGWAVNSPVARLPLASQLEPARQEMLIKGKPGVRLELAITFEAGRKHLPIVMLARVA
jgi:hypothetical protein